jgi:hypothetical protein
MQFCMKRLGTLKSFKIFKSEIKKSKPIAVDVLLKGFLMVPLSCNQTVPLSYSICYIVSALPIHRSYNPEPGVPHPSRELD